MSILKSRFYLILALSVAMASIQVSALELGQSIPKKVLKTSLLNVDGTSMSLNKLIGKKGTLVIFSCNACPFVKAWNERMVTLGNTYSKKGFGVVMVNSNDPSQNPEDGIDVMKTRSKELNMEFPYVVDSTSSVARQFDAKKTPEAFLFNAQRTLVYHGAIDNNHEDANAAVPYLKNAIDAVADNKPVEIKEWKALGCSIKYRSDKPHRKKA